MEKLVLKKLLVGCLAFLMVFSYWPIQSKAASPFPDIQGHYAAADILQLYEQGVISGYQDGKFYPNRDVTHAEYLRMLLDTVPVKEWIQGPLPFVQHAGHWAYDYMEQAYRSGILLDTDWNLADLKPGEKMTRADAALLLSASLDLKETSGTNPFKDLQGASAPLTQAVQALNQAGLIKGMTADTFGPQLPLTRGQISTILVRVQQYQMKKLDQRLSLQTVITEVKGDVKVLIDQTSKQAKVGDVLPVGSEIQTGAQSGATLKLTDGDTLYVDENSRLSVQELDISLEGEKSGELKAQEFKIVEDAILLRGKANEKNIDLNWQADKPVNSYSIFKARNEKVNPSGNPTLKGSKSTKWVDTNIEPGHTYHYQVVGATDANEGLGSKEVSFEVVKKASFKLWAGNVFAKVKSLFSPNSKFEVQTPTTTAGVRGTSFSVSVGKQGRTSVGVYTGAVGVRPGQSPGQADEMMLKPNEKAQVDQGKDPVKQSMDLTKEDPFIKNSLAKVINQEKWEQQQLEEQMKKMKEKLDQRLQDSMTQLPPAQQQPVQEAKSESTVGEPPLPPVEEDKATKESNELEQAAANEGIQDALEADENQANTDGTTTPPPPPPPPSSSGGGNNHNPPPATITSIPSIYKGVAVNGSFTLPTTVTAKMSDGTTKQVSVTWSPASSSNPSPIPPVTTKAGAYYYHGTVQGYTDYVGLTLGVEAPLGSVVPVVTGEPLAFDGGVILDLGPTTIPSDTTVTVQKVDTANLPSIPGDLQAGGQVYSFAFEPSINSSISNQPVMISLPMNSTVDADKTAIYYFNESDSTWEYQPTHNQDGKLYAAVSHFSKYAALTDKTAPTPPTVTFTKASSSVSLILSGASDYSGIQQYKIYRNGSELETIWAAGSGVSQVYEDFTVEPGQTYTYSVKAVDPLGNVSESSSTLEVTTDNTMTSFTGLVKDINEDPVSGATIKFRKGRNNYSGEPVDQATTDSTGTYSINLPSGTYTGEVIKEGYITSYFVTGNDSDVILVAQPTEGQIRIVLTWGELPEDLDSHLNGPSPDGTGFHTYYGRDEYVFEGNKLVDLDIDDTDSFGPEVTTVYQKSDGTYKFFVHNYSGEEINLKTSGAKVDVYLSNSTTPTKTYLASDASGNGDEYYWQVFEMSVDQSGIVFRDIQSLTQPNSEASIQTSDYTITENTIAKVPYGTKVVDFMNHVTLPEGATLRVSPDYDEGTARTGQDLLEDGDLVWIMSEDGHTELEYTIDLLPVVIDVTEENDDSSLVITEPSATNPTYRSSLTTNTQYMTNPVGPVTITFSEDIEKDSIEDIHLYLNGSMTQASDVIKNLLFNKFYSGAGNELSTISINMSYMQLVNAMALYNDSQPVTSMEIVVYDLQGNPLRLDLEIDNSPSGAVN